MIGDDIYIGGVNIKGWVAMPQATWEGVVTKRVIADTLSHRKGTKIALMASQAYDDSLAKAKLGMDVMDERALKNTARMERDDCMTMNGKLSRKVRNRTPWARAAQVQVCVIVVAGIVFGYQQLAP